MQLMCRIHDREILLRVDKTTKWVGLKITVDDLYVIYVGGEDTYRSKESVAKVHTAQATLKSLMRMTYPLLSS